MQPFGHNRHGPKIGGSAPFLMRGSWVPIQHNVAWAEAYLHNKWFLDPCSRLATTDMGRKLGEASAPFLGGAATSLSNTMSLGSRFTILPSGILIHRAIWPHQIWAENWGLCPFGKGDLLHLTQCGHGRSLAACQVSS